MYRFSTDEKRAYWAEQKAKQRKKKKVKPASTPVTGERNYLEAERNGASPAELDQIVTSSLPPQREQDFPVSEQPTSNHPEFPEE